MGSTVRSTSPPQQLSTGSLRWRSWPLVDQPTWSWLVPLSIILVSSYVYWLGGWFLATLTCAALITAFWQFMLPVSYEVTSLGLRRLALRRVRLVPWPAIRAYRNAGNRSGIFSAARPNGDGFAEQFVRTLSARCGRTAGGRAIVLAARGGGALVGPASRAGQVAARLAAPTDASFGETRLRLAPCQFGVEGVTEAVAEEVQRVEREAEGGAGIYDQPPVNLHRRDHFDALVRQEAPGDIGRLNAQAEERQERFEQHHARNREREVHDHDADEVRKDVPGDDSGLAAPIARAASTNGSVLSEITWPRTTRAIVSQ